MTPGSLKLVLRRVDITNRNITAPTTGMAGVTLVAKKGQLKEKREKFITFAAIVVHHFTLNMSSTTLQAVANQRENDIIEARKADFLVIDKNIPQIRTVIMDCA